MEVNPNPINHPDNTSIDFYDGSDVENRSIVQLTSTPTKVEIEKSLRERGILATIERTKDELSSSGNLLSRTIKELRGSFCNHPVLNSGKVLGLTVTMATLYPLMLGALACFLSFRVAEPSEMFSDDMDEASNAVGLYGNLGHGIGYPVEAIEINTLFLGFLLWGPYKKAKQGIIEESYMKVIDENKSSLTKKESDFLWKLKEHEVSWYR